jgi:Uma2 family endonuclease
MSVTEIGRKLVTAEEFEQFADREHLDLIRGELRPMPPPPGGRHGSVTMRFSNSAYNHVLEHNLGECFAAETRFTIERNPDTSIGPDWAFVSIDRLPNPIPDGFMPVVPDAVLEVRSPSDTRREVEEKVQRWLAAGVRLVWELNPRTQTMTVYRPGTDPQVLGIDDTLSGEDVLPGFTLPLRRLFASSLPSP